MKRLRLVKDLPIDDNDDPEIPFDVTIRTSEGVREATYAEVESFTFEVSERYPNGAVIMKRTDGSAATYICRSGDTVSTPTGSVVEAVDV